MSTKDIERAQIEEVFSLGGGELADKPWTGEANNLQYTFPYWYEGVPEYASEDFGDQHDFGCQHRTVIVDVDPYSGVRAPEQITHLGEIWKRAKVYQSSGERECPFRDWDLINREDKPRQKYPATNRVTVEETHLYDQTDKTTCPLCEAEIGEEHGHIYLGDMAECVYKLDRKANVVDALTSAGLKAEEQTSGGADWCVATWHVGGPPADQDGALFLCDDETFDAEPLYSVVSRWPGAVARGERDDEILETASGLTLAAAIKGVRELVEISAALRSV